ncbi:hypothetical protein [Streptomyces sp. NPDC003480]
MECERCGGTGVDPETYIVQRGSDGGLRGYANAPCTECQPDDDIAAPVRPDDEPT